jgi:malate dehydrogenase (oxaloacetate-decarboxylating)
MIQFEDFAQRNAMPLLQRYRHKVCCFNDDIQGTAAVTVGTLLAACRTRGDSLSDLKIVFVGAGSAGCGIAEQVIRQMCAAGITDTQARQQIFMVDRDGLLVEDTEGLRDFQQALWQARANLASWEYSDTYPSLLDVVACARPDILIGVSGQAGLFSEPVIRTMKQHCERPIVLPLSNPSSRIEATPQQIIEWTDGQALVATGSPYDPVVYAGKTYSIPQCNNSYIFPGIGLGVLSAGAARISDEMIMAASEALAAASPLANTSEGGLLPPLTEISGLSHEIAFVVGKVAQQQDHALAIPDEVLRSKIESNFWAPDYRRYRRSSA